MFDNDILVYNTILIRDALEKLDKTAEKVLLVVDSDKRLVGTLTDGDIRRHILKGAELSDNIKSVYQTDPIFVSQDEFNSEMIKKTFIENKVELIPVLDQDHRVVDFITWDIAFGDIERTEKENLKVPVVIMAGGKGERLEPFTRILPKLLIPVGNKPVVEHIIDKFREHGINEFYLTINHMSKIVRAYFEEKNPDYSLIFVEESEPRGTAGSLKLLADKFKKPFFVSNCDIIIEANYADLYQFHVENKHDITLVASAKQFNIPYGICELNGDGSLESLCEKPKYNFLVNTGLYILDPKVIELIPDHELFHITQLIDKIKERKGSIGVYPVSEKAWVDVGQWEEYKKSIEKMQIFK